jgi:two-component system OmpR family sensor kinase
LGLAIIKAIAERHGATLTLGQSERLGGLLVQIRFPAGDKITSSKSPAAA